MYGIVISDRRKDRNLWSIRANPFWIRDDHDQRYRETDDEVKERERRERWGSKPKNKK